MSFLHNEYEYLSLLLDRYRSTHALDRAARSALVLLSSDIEEARLKSKKSNVIKLSRDYISSNDIPIKKLEEIIMTYDNLSKSTSNDIILMLTSDGHIDAKDANHYYRALVASQSVLDKLNGE